MAQHLLIYGRVQGVGYRETMRAQAHKAGCTGWVRNRPDGCVEAMIDGQPEAVSQLMAWVRRGPPAARVDRVETAERGDSFMRFEVLRGT